jgi:DNA (cytosine-5)-methyltransferase 1
VAAFAGGGGFCIGLALAGGSVCLANEIVPEAVRSYHANFPAVPVDARDIRAIVKGTKEIEDFLGQASLQSGAVDVLSGGPPCRDFSTGRRTSGHGGLRRYSDIVQKDTETLIFDFAKLAHGIRPKIIIGENVPALATRFPILFGDAMNAIRVHPETSIRQVLRQVTP